MQSLIKGNVVKEKKSTRLNLALSFIFFFLRLGTFVILTVPPTPCIHLLKNLYVQNATRPGTNCLCILEIDVKLKQS